MPPSPPATHTVPAHTTPTHSLTRSSAHRCPPACSARPGAPNVATAYLTSGLLVVLVDPPVSIGGPGPITSYRLVGIPVNAPAGTLTITLSGLGVAATGNQVGPCGRVLWCGGSQRGRQCLGTRSPAKPEPPLLTRACPAPRPPAPPPTRLPLVQRRFTFAAGTFVYGRTYSFLARATNGEGEGPADATPLFYTLPATPWYAAQCAAHPVWAPVRAALQTPHLFSKAYTFPAGSSGFGDFSAFTSFGALYSPFPPMYEGNNTSAKRCAWFMSNRG